MTEGMVRLTVMLIDKSPLVCQRLHSALSTIDGVCVLAKLHEAANALEVAARLAPDVVILDPSLNGSDGRLVLENLRARVPRTKVLVLTTDCSPSNRVRFLSAGAYACMDKALELDVLKALIAQLRN
ncbi:MAG: response regulator [Burkholderiaceae bacterium]